MITFASRLTERTRRPPLPRSPISSTIISGRRNEVAPMSTRTIHGVGASAGIAIGPVFRYEVREQVVERRHADDTAAEQARLDAALAQAQAEIQALAAKARHDVGSSNASIFEAH